MADRPKGDRAMRLRGLRKVSFWLTDAEHALCHRAKGKCGPGLGARARALLLAWAEAQAERNAETYAGARRELGG